MSTRYEKMGPISTTRRIRNDIDPNPGEGQEQPNAAAQRNGHHNHNSPYYSRGDTSDYAFALLFGMVGILLSRILILPRLPTFITHNQLHRFFHRDLSFFIVYIWSKQWPQHRINLFGVVMSAAYLPFAYLVMGYALNNGQRIPVDILQGMFVGHIYFYLACVVPKVLIERQLAVLSTPTVLIDLLNWLEGRGNVGGGVGGNDGPVLVVTAIII